MATKIILSPSETGLSFRNIKCNGNIYVDYFLSSINNKTLLRTLTICLTRLLSYKNQEQLTLRKYMGSQICCRTRVEPGTANPS